MSYASAEFDRRIATLIQVGTIAQVDYLSAHCRVKIGEWVSAWMPWASLGAGVVRHWRPPSVGEQSMLLCPSGESSAGFVLPGFYSSQHQQGNDNRPNITAWLMPDGTLFEYDFASHRLRIDVKGAASIQISGNANIQVGGNANVRIDGWGEVIAQGRLLIKSLTRLILKGPSREIVL